MNRLKSIDRRYLYALYWLLFACFSVSAAGNPGYVLHSEDIPFPWGSLIVIWALLALGVGSLCAILGPSVFKTPWPRYRKALALTGTLLVFCILTFATDMPELSYIPMWFSFITFAGLMLIGFFRAVFSLKNRRQNTP